MPDLGGTSRCRGFCRGPDLFPGQGPRTRIILRGNPFIEGVTVATVAAASGESSAKGVQPCCGSSERRCVDCVDYG